MGAERSKDGRTFAGGAGGCESWRRGSGWRKSTGEEEDNDGGQMGITGGGISSESNDFVVCRYLLHNILWIFLEIFFG